MHKTTKKFVVKCTFILPFRFSKQNRYIVPEVTLVFLEILTEFLSNNLTEFELRRLKEDECYMRGTRWRSGLRHCAKSRNVVGSIRDDVTGICHCYNPSGRTMALGLTQPLTEMSTRNNS
jgi:hypothetical protein